jgi:cell division protease FtsH
MLIQGADPVRKVSIIPRGSSLGVTLSSPDSDRFNYTDVELAAAIRVLLAGRAAEEIVFGDLTSGAESDLEQLTNVVRYMVGRWGMSDSVGMMTAIDRDLQATASPQTLGLLDDEVRRIGDEAYADILRLLRDERHRLDALVEALMVHETLDAGDAYAAAGLTRPVVATRDPHPPLALQERASLGDDSPTAIG